MILNRKQVLVLILTCIIFCILAIALSSCAPPGTIITQDRAMVGESTEFLKLNDNVVRIIDREAGVVIYYAGGGGIAVIKLFDTNLR